MNRFWKIWSIVVSVIVLVCVFIILMNVNKTVRDTELGLTAVKYLYHFSGLEELDDNMDRLREITTPEVYEQLTIDNTERALNVYLKFKNNPTLVVPDKVTNNYVVYSLETDSLSSFRKFAFFFNVNREGKIDYVRESEVIDFVGSDRVID